MSLTKIGILGGTFDPVHLGHLQLAESAVEEFGLDQMLFIPAALPPHKDGTRVTSFAHRAAMLQLACAPYRKFNVNLIEEQLPKPSYSIDTLKQLQKHYGDGVRLFFVLGIDSFLDIGTWKAYRSLLKLVTVIISLRKGYEHRLLLQLLADLGYEMETGNSYRRGSSQEVLLLKATPEAISSSSIRTRIGRGESFQQLLPPGVEQYITKHMLYNYNFLGNCHSDN